MTQPNEDKPDHLEKFIRHLRTRDRAAFAELRRSLSFEPGASPTSFPFVERFVSAARSDWERRSFYLVAGLFALVERPLEKGVESVQEEPETTGQKESRRSFGHAVADLYESRGRTPSVEARFIALLDADEEQLPNRLRQVASLLRADGVRVGWAELLESILNWNHDNRFVQRRWASDFYKAVGAEENAVQDAEQ